MLGGLSVVEVAVGASDLGLGLAGGVPGMLFADLGADVVRVVGTSTPAIDADVPWGRSWHRDKRVVATDDAGEIRSLLHSADVAFVYGSEEDVEGRGLGYDEIAVANPGLVYARCRGDFGLLVEAASGFCTQLAGHRDGPIFVDARAPGAGAAFLMTTSALALLRRRTARGAGGWSETTLYDGLLATLGCMIGRSERAAPEIEKYWEQGSWFPNFLYRCADGALLQVWFGGKGMYDKLIDVLGDEPSVDGYYQDQAAGRLNDRAVRWRELFLAQPRDVWIDRLRAAGVACEPVLAPGDALSEPHLVTTGLAVHRSELGRDDVVAGSPIAVAPLDDGEVVDVPAVPPGRLLEGLHVLDFSAFVAGPLGAQVLADLGADVIKVEPLGGEAMRGAAYAIAACQRGKRSLALDINAPEARPVVERLIGWADVVLHNFRVGVSERLGIDEATVARLNPRAVYCHASAFGGTGPRATFPGNDALMQALTGFEQAIGGDGNDPIAATWIPLDMCGGWVAAAGILAGLYARATTGQGQQVATSLLGAAMLVQSGVFQRDGDLVRGPRLDRHQTGYGPGYRIYECAGGEWLALVVPDHDAWLRLRALPDAPALPVNYAPLRGGPDGGAAHQAEAVLERLFATAPASAWVERLRDAGVRAEPVRSMSRDEFRQGILDDPVNIALGRVASYETADWGHFEQIGPLLRCGPDADGGPPLFLPRVGEHTVDVLTDLGFTTDQVDSLLTAKVARQL